ncbi:MAG TPA: hypothetical protein VGG11_12990 [Xanthobacteraceae bacterium]|jgi:hypothetical protein
MTKRKLHAKAHEKTSSAPLRRRSESERPAAASRKLDNKIAETSDVEYTVREQHKRLHDAFQPTTDKFIDDKATGKSDHSEPLAIRLAKLDAFAQSNPGLPVSNYLRELVPELSQVEAFEASRREAALPPIPDRAPALWKVHRHSGETCVDFTRRHYGTWLNKVLTKADVHRLDFDLYKALTYYLKAHEVSDFDLPSKEQRNDRWIERVKLTQVMPNAASSPEQLREAQRLVSALKRRQR